MEPMDGVVQFSDDDLSSVAADSWSIKSEYGSVLDADELVRQAEAMEALVASPAVTDQQDYSSAREAKEEEDNGPSVLGLRSYWDSTYASELSNFHSHGDAGEIWFGESVMDTVAEWTARLCACVSAGVAFDASRVFTPSELKGWNVLDVGTGNGVLLHALSKQGFTDLLTGIDYSEAAIELAKAVAEKQHLDHIKFLVDDLLETRLEDTFKLVTDKGTLDAIGLHPDGASRRVLYWKAIGKLVAPGGLLVITSCNHTKDELKAEGTSEGSPLEYVDHIRSYPTFRFNGVEGSPVSTVAFRRPK